MLALSKTLDPTDFEQLTDELAVVDRYFTSAREQHPLRRWEYALALRAATTWRAQATPHSIGWADVGGAGSPFHRMLTELLDVDPTLPRSGRIIDPDLPINSCTLAEHLAQGAALRELVFCLSVLEHVEDLDQFLYHLSCLVAPGGLLFLTLDYCDALVDDWPEDRYHFHWMRRRIANQYGWRLGGAEVLTQQHSFSLLGDHDWTYHGDHVFNYSFASLALVKRA